MFKSFDRYKNTPSEPTAAGGAISISTVLATVVYLAFYILTSSNSSYPTDTSVVMFPQRQSDTTNPDNMIRLPPLHCVSKSGCWYRPYLLEDVDVGEGGGGGAGGEGEGGEGEGEGEGGGGGGGTRQQGVNIQQELHDGRGVRTRGAGAAASLRDQKTHRLGKKSPDC